MESSSKVLVLDNESEARLLEAVLREREIPHMMRSYHDSAYDGLWQVQHGWGHVEAPLSRHEEIRRIHGELFSPGGGSGSGADSGAGDQEPFESD